MGNYVIGAGNYVIATPSDLGNYVSADSWAWSAVMGEIAGGYRLVGDVQPPPFPLSGGLGWLIGGGQVVSAERAEPVLPG